MLWAQLTEHHRKISGDPSMGGDDPGLAFDDYLATRDRLSSWVADLHGAVVGLTRLLDHGTSGEVEPVIVAERVRGRGVGRVLIERAVTEAVARGYEYLTILPVPETWTPFDGSTTLASTRSGTCRSHVGPC
jgi:GNAT superfamily N-acetyltransferase